MKYTRLPIRVLFGCSAVLATVAADGIPEEVTIIGAREDAERTAGSAHVISAAELERFLHTDIQRIIQQVPGVSVQMEDGYGLRPNIGIRGVATERSSRITLLEDGVLIAPAPYSAPAAYYFPTVGRMASFEVLKGPSAIVQGPYTIGGAFNMVSTPIPTQRGGRLFAETGDHATNRLHATYGATTERGFGYLLEIHYWASNGYQSVDRSDRDTGLNVHDYMLKLAYAPPTSPHRLELKLQSADQKSNQSYLGLTDADFRADATRRYGLTSLDRIDTDHRQEILRYEFAPGERFKLTVTGYQNRHTRNWFKTEGIDFDGSLSAQKFQRTSWFSVVQAINSGANLGGQSAGRLADVLNGTVDTPAGSIQVRANDRRYQSWGVQADALWHVAINDVSHAIHAGVRYHEDEEDRLQRNSTYSQRNGMLSLDERGLLGNAGNRIQRAEALAMFIQDRIESGPWTLTLGLRYEDIEQHRRRYETRPGRTSDPASRAAANLRDTRSNSTHLLLPGIGMLYRVSQAITLIAGVHKGFTAPSNASDADAEEALNFELGVRTTGARGRFEAIAFLSDYDNLLGECTSSSGVDCEIGAAFNGDAATIKGLELTAATDLTPGRALSMPLELVYTWMEGSFDTDIVNTDFFGDVSAGDPLPYIPEHQLHSLFGILGGRWAVHLSVHFVDSVCVRASCDGFETTDDALTIDVAGRFSLNSRVDLFARIENLADANNLLGRHPYGARTNKGRTATIGFDIVW